MAGFRLFRGYAQRTPKFLACFQVARGEVHTKAVRTIEELESVYNERKCFINESKNYTLIDEQTIFANNELGLRHIEVYGFDYDYTLASYSNTLHYLIYDLAVKELISTYGYPRGIEVMKYDPHFAIRGLHFDTSSGLLLKVDAFHNIMLGSVYRGLQPVPNDEVFKIYEGTHLAITKINPSNFLNGPRRTMHHMIDLFSYPEMVLISNVIEFFQQRGIPYDPEYLFRDCQQAVQNVHKSGKMYQAVINDIDKYLKKSPHLGELLQRLVSSGKMLFLITNSGFEFVKKGMDHMIGKGWRDLFDVVITQARKPSFYHQQASRPFRCVDTRLYRPMWQKVSALCKGQVYIEGNIEQFIKFTGWYGPNVLYFGDHVYSDLRDPVLHHGWRTGAIIPELESEIKNGNSLEFQRSVVWLTNLQDLILQLKAFPPSSKRAQLTDEWKRERRELKLKLKALFNPRFGSVFRTYTNSTYFTRRLVRFADLYMSSVENLLNYPLNYTFYPRRAALPHEAVLDFRTNRVPQYQTYPSAKN
ncbi:5'-nucleotidase domain-containing protein 3 [Pocillopora verrucosa]|uniref:5'-nucleotidase domain-containing protein 3 n=1 Tax=Pocillopora verrucosa TaxID=203993 RepID=UPI00333E44CC